MWQQQHIRDQLLGAKQWNLCNVIYWKSLLRFPMSAKVSIIKPTILFTIISESVLRDRLVKLLKTHGASGYTISEAQGESQHGRCMGDIPGYNINIEIKTLVSLEVSDDLFEVLQEYKSNHALIAFRQNVEALID